MTYPTPAHVRRWETGANSPPARVVVAIYLGEITAYLPPHRPVRGAEIAALVGCAPATARAAMPARTLDEPGAALVCDAIAADPSHPSAVRRSALLVARWYRRSTTGDSSLLNDLGEATIYLSAGCEPIVTTRYGTYSGDTLGEAVAAALLDAREVEK